MYVCVCMYVFVCICVCVCMCVWYVCMYVCIELRDIPVLSLHHDKNLISPGFFPENYLVVF